MSPIVQDVQADFILPDLKALTGKQVLQALATEAALRASLDAALLYEQLIAQEEKNASGIGGGIAIPHMQVDGLSEPVMILARLSTPLEFEAADQQQVDLVFLLLSPASDGPLHLRRLSRISRVLRNERLCMQLRAAKDAHAMRNILSQPDNLLLAA